MSGIGSLNGTNIGFLKKKVHYIIVAIRHGNVGKAYFIMILSFIFTAGLPL